ncbi:abnormal spindle-like microcephaly-associated protein homolog [Ambystoma mexicanum]|uniref:abnormal spindle-like microcephaly-associated protein homolog n=1 Tax=Ambystoma mexicanum TaxID=8296 RepID=UPI0037E863B3
MQNINMEEFRDGSRRRNDSNRGGKYNKDYNVTPAPRNKQCNNFVSNRRNLTNEKGELHQNNMSNNQAAMTIQAYYRGYRVRRDLHSRIFTRPWESSDRYFKGNGLDFGHGTNVYEDKKLHDKNESYQNSCERPIGDHYQYDPGQYTSFQNSYQSKNCTISDKNEHLLGHLTQSKQKRALRTPATMDKGYWDNSPYIDIRMKNHAATIIQAAYRGYVVRKLLFELKLATISIQSFWRGYATRKKLAFQNHSVVNQEHCINSTVRYDQKVPDSRYAHAQLSNELSDVKKTVNQYNPPQVSNKEVPFSEHSQPEGLLLQKSSMGIGSRPLRQMYSYLAEFAVKVGNDVKMTNIPNNRQSTDHHTDHLRNEQGYPNQDVYLHLDECCGAKQQSRQYGIRRRKSREQLRKENFSAAKIQSTWKSYQVRKEIKEMNKAATKIQALYRGFKVRQDLQLNNGLHGSHGIISRSSDQYTSEIRFYPRRSEAPLENIPQGVCNYKGMLNSKIHQGKGRTVASQNTFCENQDTCYEEFGYQRTRHTSGANVFSLRHSNITGLTPTPTSMSNYASMNQLSQTKRKPYENCSETSVSHVWNGCHIRRLTREMHSAATKIQACYRGYKTRLFLKQTGLPTFGRYREAAGDAETYPVMHNKKSCLLQRKAQGTIAECGANLHSNCPTPASPIRNINVSTILKGVPSLRRPPISIRVSSPHGSVQGYYKGTKKGAQGHYTVRAACAQSPSTVQVNVNMVNRK